MLNTFNIYNARYHDVEMYRSMYDNVRLGLKCY